MEAGDERDWRWLLDSGDVVDAAELATRPHVVVVVDPDRVAGLASGWARRCELEAFGPYETVVDAQAALERLLEDFAEWPQLRLFLVPIYEGS